MRTVRDETVDAILNDLKLASSRQSPIDQTTGGVYCLNRNLECVAFKLGDRTLLLEFQIPYFLTQVQIYEEILLKTTTGGYFVPKLEHRYLNVSFLSDDCVLTQLCALPASELPAVQTALADAMRNAVIVYYRSYPNANQYFYMFDANTKDLMNQVCTDISPALQEKYAFEYYANLAEPYGGFSLTSKSL